jgi:hypothetical protein
MSRHAARNLGPLKLTPFCLPLQNFVGACVGILTARRVTLAPASLRAGKFVNKIVLEKQSVCKKSRRPKYLWLKHILFSDAQDDGENVAGP